MVSARTVVLEKYSSTLGGSVQRGSVQGGEEWIYRYMCTRWFAVESRLLCSGGLQLGSGL
jgi:hypothetical protein